MYKNESKDPLVRWVINGCNNIELNLKLNDGITLSCPKGMDAAALIATIIKYWEEYQKGAKDDLYKGKEVD